MTVEGFKGFFAGGFNWADVDTVWALGELIASRWVVTARRDSNGKWSSVSRVSGKFRYCGPDYVRSEGGARGRHETQV